MLHRQTESFEYARTIAARPVMGEGWVRQRQINQDLERLSIQLQSPVKAWHDGVKACRLPSSTGCGPACSQARTNAPFWPCALMHDYCESKGGRTLLLGSTMKGRFGCYTNTVDLAVIGSLDHAGLLRTVLPRKIREVLLLTIRGKTLWVIPSGRRFPKAGRGAWGGESLGPFRVKT